MNKRVLLFGIIDFLLFSNIFVSICAAALVAVSKMLLNAADDFYLEIFVFFSTLAIYNFQRLLPLAFDKNKDIHSFRHQWINKHRLLLLFISVFALALSLFIFFLFFNEKEKIIYLLIPLSLLSLWYSKGFFYIPRLRKIPYFKIFLISLIWLFITVLLPAIELGFPIFSKDILFVSAERFLLIFAITLPFDIRDLEVDKLNNIKTIPRKIGIEKTKMLVYFLLIVSSFISLSRIYFVPGTEWSALPLIIANVFIISIVAQADQRRSEYFYTGTIESTMLIQFLILALARYI